jgi:hypothetical protein
LASLHARALAMSPDSFAPLPAVAASPGHTATAQPSASRLSATVDQSPETEGRKAVADLSAQVLTLQEQLTQLTLEVLRERSERYEQRLSALEALLLASVPKSSPAPPQPPPPVKPPAPTRPLPRIEYSPSGLSVLVCPQAGVLSFPRDSPQWFDWLASLVSFRFYGQSGRFSAYREGLTRSWKAFRSFHGRSLKRSLGTTDGLTIAHLEQVATSLQAEMTSL